MIRFMLRPLYPGPHWTADWSGRSGKDTVSVRKYELCHKHVWGSAGLSPGIHNFGLESRVKAGSNTPTVSLRVVRGNEKGIQCLGV
jgi:hypothetical protein